MVGSMNISLHRLGTALLLACLISVPTARATPVSWISVNPSKSGFVLSQTGAAFIPWGFNYSRDDRHRLLEDYWNTAGADGWAKVERDFREMKRLGANVVRINLQFASFMEAPGRPNPSSLARLEKLIDLAESLHLYLDITGLGTFRAAQCRPGTTICLNGNGGRYRPSFGMQLPELAQTTLASLPMTS